MRRIFQKYFGVAALGMVAWFALGTAVWLGLPAASATVMVALDLRELTERADEVAIFEAVAQKTRRDRYGRIVNDVIIRAKDSAIKGQCKKGDELLLTHLGGCEEDSDVCMHVTGEPAFATGKQYVLFCTHSASDPTRLRAVGMSQGVMPVTQDKKTGEELVDTSSRGLALVRRVGSGFTRLASSPYGIRTLPELTSTLKMLVADEKARAKAKKH